jgi:hypothetical protein
MVHGVALKSSSENDKRMALACPSVVLQIFVSAPRRGSTRRT